MRNIAIYQDKVFVATTDARLVALDARTGRRSGIRPIADRAKGYANTTGPIVMKGIVINGLVGCDRYGNDGCCISAYDAETGKQLWKFNTVARAAGTGRRHAGASSPTTCASAARPGSPAATIPISTSPTGASRRRSRGCGPAAASSNFDNALYTSSTVALRPKDGTLAWHYQHAPGESLDLDEVFERVLVDIGDQKVVFTIGKPGMLWKLDRRNGAVPRLQGNDVPERVRVDRSEDRHADLSRRHPRAADRPVGDSCPSTEGGHNWQAMSYVPSSGVLVIPLSQSCMADVGPQDRVRPTAPAAPARIAASSRCRAATATSASSPPTTSRR